MIKTSGFLSIGILLLFSAIIFLGCASTPALQKEIAINDVDPGLREIIEKYRASIPQLMKKDEIPGLSIAVVNRTRILWAAGFGTTDTDGKTAITPDTLFSLQSASKSITATLVMLAVQDRILDLDKPITRAIPGFTIKSRFEEKPSELITLRNLLYNTSGLGHEAPVGNNISPNSPSFEDHIQSISETWLKYRVGERYSYSNLGFDLAAFAIQSASGMPFVRYSEKKLFKELGMDRSTFDQVVVSAIQDRAIGHDRNFSFVPTKIPMLGSGGAWTTAQDLGRFVQFHLAHGKVGGRQLLDAQFLNSMYLLPATWSSDNYVMGFVAWKRNGSYYLNHNGGGFGFYTTMTFFPEFGIGCIVLTNSVNHDLKVQTGLVDSILDTMISSGHTDKAVSIRFPSVEEVFRTYPAQAPITERIANFGTPWQQNYAKYIGAYRYIWGQWRFTSLHSPENTDVDIRQCNERLCVNSEILEEFQPGLFFTESGESLDFTSTPPRWKNVSIEKIR
jgi:CubicO group peptidase (beta-lactamase class C family)